MKEYQYSIIRRESRNPKRRRQSRGVSQSDLEALKNELEGNNKDTDLIISDIRDSISDLDSLSVSIEDFASSATDIKQRLAGAEQSIAGKLDTSAFESWKAEDFNEAISGKLDQTEFKNFLDVEYYQMTHHLAFEIGLAGRNFEEFKKSLNKSNYKVVVSKRGEIRNGKVYDGVDYNGSKAILHTAQIYTLLGEDATASQGKNLTWTVNKERTTAPLERTVTGVACYVTEADFVYNQFDLHHYDIQLESKFTAPSNP